MSATDQVSATRRCWRCLQTFACEPDEVIAAAPEWWLCEPCQLALLGPRDAGQR
jgi:hypothetical protein